MNILFLGNSYTYYNDLPALFRGLCKENNQDVEVFSVTAPGRRLEQNLQDDAHAARFKELLQQRHYDFCILQEQSVLPFVHFDAYLSALLQLKNILKGHSDRLLLYSTWGRKEGESFLTENHLTNPQMTALLHSAFEKASEITEIPISPVGLHFYDLYSAGIGPELYDADRTHPSYSGSCLAALVHYKTMFGVLPDSLQSFELSEWDRKTLLACAGKNLSLQAVCLDETSGAADH